MSFFSCDIVVNDQIVGTSVSDRRNDARDDAQDLALQNLSRRCYTLLIKNKFASEGGTLVDIDDLSAFSKSDDSLTSNNIGHKLLQMMVTLFHLPHKQCDQIGRFIALWATFQSLWQQLFCPNRPHF